LGFDEFGEKFYTGGSDGKIRVWFILVYANKRFREIDSLGLEL
jgi:hypothetical protein